MDTKFGKPVPYDATAVRPEYGTLPAEVRADIAARLGGEPVEISKAGGGFTGGFAGVLTAASGDSVFVKAAGPQTPYVVGAYTREAYLNPALPAQVPAPRLRYSAEVDGWVVLGFEPVRGRAPRLPMSPRDLTLMLDAWGHAASALTPPPQSILDLGLHQFAEDAGEQFNCFRAVASGEVQAPQLPQLTGSRIDELAALEEGMAAAVTVDAVIHGDLRPDNMILGEDQAWICDWTFSCIGAPWFDTAAFLVLAHGDGHDADGLFQRHSTARGVTPEQLDSVLAAITGYYLCNSDKPLIDRVSPHIRAHQRWNGLATLDWLSARRGW